MRLALLLAGLTLLSACQFIQPDASEPTLTATSSPTTAPTTPAPSPTLAREVDSDTIEIEIEPTPTLPAESSPSTPTPGPETSPGPALDSLTPHLIPVADGFKRPVFLTHAGDGSGRLFVVEQAGKILIIKDGQVYPTPFLDIVSIVGSSANEQGLLSVAFHPDYADNGLFFVNYTNKQGDTTLARYQVSDDNPDVADPNRAKILLTIEQPFGNHNGGQLVFGPDGYLYVGMGDGGSANDPFNNGQNLDTLLGKILRLDVDQADPYGVPPDNPFVNQSDARPEVWSYGWRNPWRISFDRATANMYVADVGQNNYEEVNVEVAGTSGGQNYGWRLMEGLNCFNPSDCDPASLEVVLPLVEYDHTQGCSVTGGYVYRGALYPELTGVYFYGDYCSGIVWGLRQESDGSWSQAQLLQTITNISSFGQDEAGEVYLIHHSGDIFQIGH